MSATPGDTDRQSLAAEVNRLFARESYAEAAALVRGRLAGDLRGDPGMHGLLALAMLFQGQPDGALDVAHTAVRQAPDLAFTHYVLAVVLDHREQFNEALISIREAIRLDATTALYHAEMGLLYVQLRRWVEARAAGERGLEMEPGNDDCRRVVAQAQRALDRWSESGAGAGSEQESELAAANLDQGLAALAAHRAGEALAHLHQALAFSPRLVPALWGVVRAFRLNCPLRGRLLGWLLRLSLAPWTWGVAVMLGVGVAVPLAASVFPGSVVVLGLGALAGAVVCVVCLARPLFHLVLRFSALGRPHLARRQARQADWLALLLLLAAGWAVAGLVRHDGRWLAQAVVTLWLSIAVTNVLAFTRGWPRRLLTACLAVLLALAGVTAVASWQPLGVGLPLLLGVLAVGVLGHSALTAVLAGRPAPLSPGR